MRFHISLLLLLLVPGCPESRALPLDAASADVPPSPDAPPVLDAPRDAGSRSDVLVVASVPELAGRSVWMRLYDTSVGAVTPWRDRTAPPSGAFEERFAGGMPRDVFGVFLEVFVDDGDGVCSGDPAYQVFVSNDFTDEVRVVFTADPDTGVPCATLTR